MWAFIWGCMMLSAKVVFGSLCWWIALVILILVVGGIVFGIKEVMEK